jgi:hypothetical protein
MRTSLLTVLAVALVLAFGGVAMAQTTPTTDAYPGHVLGHEVQNNGDTTRTAHEEHGSTTGTTPTGNLPFTGFQVGIVVLVGVSLVGLGFAMRRTTRRNGI